jgi:hypothetical protein
MVSLASLSFLGKSSSLRAVVDLKAESHSCGVTLAAESFSKD